jgi:hypothetical protein
MSIAGIRRRLRALEALGGRVLIDKHPPLTWSEVFDIEQRARGGEQRTKLELVRVERQSPIIDGELLMTAHRGRLFMKRYLGIDLAEV